MNYLQNIANARKLTRESLVKHPKICLSSSLDSIVLLHLTGVCKAGEGRWKRTPGNRGECGIPAHSHKS